MNKKTIVFLVCFISLLSSFYAQNLKLIDYEGKKDGKEIERWVMDLLSGNIEKVKDNLYPNNDYEIFYDVQRDKNYRDARRNTYISIQKNFCNIINRYTSKFIEENYPDYSSSHSLVKFDFSFTLENENRGDDTIEYVNSLFAKKDSNVTITNQIGFLNKSFDKHEYWAKIEEYDDNNTLINTFYEVYTVWAIDKRYIKNLVDSIVAITLAPPADEKKGSIKIFNYFYDNEDINCVNEITNVFDPFGNILFTDWNRNLINSFEEKEDDSIKSIQCGVDLLSLQNNPLPKDVHEKFGYFIPESIITPLLTKKSLGYIEVEMEGNNLLYYYYSVWDIDKNQLLKEIKKLKSF